MNPKVNPELLPILAMLVIVSTPFVLYEIRTGRRRRRLRRMARAMGGPISPLHVRFVLDENLSGWARRKATEFERLGFVRVAAIRVEGATRREIVLLSPDGGLRAHVLTGTIHGNVLQVSRVSMAGESVTVTTRPAHDRLPRWDRRISVRRASPGRLVARLGREVLPGEPLVLTAEGLLPFLEREHRRMTEWILQNGKLRAEMIPPLERLTGMRADPETVEYLRRAHEGSQIYPRGLKGRG